MVDNFNWGWAVAATTAIKANASSIIDFFMSELIFSSANQNSGSPREKQRQNAFPLETERLWNNRQNVGCDFLSNFTE
ncbi:hypothetical protein EVA_04452 [gut metagenome]|uniref:Uncharacterized protein n=1 Tax=gut metagenome TaxID=749906 RepID=J9GIM1_9ZZZZ